MRLSHFITAVSIKDLKAKHPQHERYIDLAVKMGAPIKYVPWLLFLKGDKKGSEYDLGFLIGLLKKFDQALASHKLDKLIKLGKLSPQAKDIGWWQKPMLPTSLSLGPLHPVELMEKVVEETKTLVSRKDIKAAGSDLVYKSDTFLVYSPKDLAATKLIGSGTKWCITGEDGTFADYSRSGYVFFFIIAPSVGDHDPHHKIAVAVNRFLRDHKTEYYLADDDRISANDAADWVTAYGTGSDWSPMMAKIFSYADKVGYRGERRTDDIWFGDVVELGERLRGKGGKGKGKKWSKKKGSKKKGVSGKKNLDWFVISAIEELPDTVQHKFQDELPSELASSPQAMQEEQEQNIDKLADLLDYIEGARGKVIHDPERRAAAKRSYDENIVKVEWQTTGNELADKILDVIRIPAYLLTVVKEISPHASVATHGLIGQPSVEL